MMPNRQQVGMIIAELPFISAASNWLKLLLSLLAEPLMFVSSLYIVAETVIPGAAHFSGLLTNGTNTVMSLAPEIILPGCFQQAQHAMNHGNKIKAGLLYTLCSLFGLLTLLTLASFVWHYTDAFGAVLLFIRCASGIAYTIILNISGPAEEVSMLLPQHQQMAMFAEQTQATVQQMMQQSNDLAQQFALLSQQTTKAQQQSQTSIQQIAASVQQISKDHAANQQSAARQAANLALLQQSNEKSTANMDRLAEAVSQVKEELSTPRPQSQQKIFALPARPAKANKANLTESKEFFALSEDQQSDTGDLLAVDIECMGLVQGLAALPALADLEQEDILKVIQEYRGGTQKSQIYQRLGWGSAKHTKIVKPVIDAYEQLSKEQQAM